MKRSEPHTNKSRNKRYESTQRYVALLILACCLVLAGCDSSTNDKNKVFRKVFQVAAPTNANIIAASYYAQRIGPMLDGEELVLDVELPLEFLNANLPYYQNAPQATEDLLFKLIGVNREKEAAARALDGCPSWFRPNDTSMFSITAPKTNAAIISFSDSEPTNQFQVVLNNHGCLKVFIDRKSGRVYIHYKH